MLHFQKKEEEEEEERENEECEIHSSFSRSRSFSFDFCDFAENNDGDTGSSFPWLEELFTPEAIESGITTTTTTTTSPALSSSPLVLPGLVLPLFVSSSSSPSSSPSSSASRVLLEVKGKEMGIVKETERIDRPAEHKKVIDTPNRSFSPANNLFQTLSSYLSACYFTRPRTLSPPSEGPIQYRSDGGNSKSSKKNTLMHQHNQQELVDQRQSWLNASGRYIIEKVPIHDFNTKWTQTKSSLKKTAHNLWFGGSPEIVEEVSKKGFDDLFIVVSEGRLGRGIYFATQYKFLIDDGYAKPDADERYTFLYCGVICGYSTVWRDNRQSPPIQEEPNVDDYESTIDDVMCPKYYVVYNPHQCYPMVKVVLTPKEKKKTETTANYTFCVKSCND